jgi:hypothetical protein
MLTVDYVTLYCYSFISVIYVTCLLCRNVIEITFMLQVLMLSRYDVLPI